jgi:hypothetical protein
LTWRLYTPINSWRSRQIPGDRYQVSGIRFLIPDT